MNIDKRALSRGTEHGEVHDEASEVGEDDQGNLRGVELPLLHA